VNRVEATRRFQELSGEQQIRVLATFGHNLRSIMGLRIAVVGIVGLCLLWGGTMNAQAKPDESVVGRVAVTAKGAVTFDGVVVTVDVLKQKLADLKKRNGVVWYYREAGKGEPPAQAMEAMKLVVDNRLPISMSTKPDYSDVLLPDGTTRPRPATRRP
jgi:hypothetical protein